MANFHKKPFDQSTLVKLDLFEKYTQAWLPVFTSQSNRSQRLTLVDFFAGPGKDANGVDGSPLVILRQVRRYTEAIASSNVAVSLEFNEAVASKARNLEKLLDEHSIPDTLCRWTVRSLAFEDAFETLYPRLSRGPNLLFLDQQGMKFISDEVFLKMTEIPQTDFIFFIASSFIRRFAEHPYFKKHLTLPAGMISARTFNDTHRAITDYYRDLLGPRRDYFVGSFSIKKGSNLYGLIFGSPHPLGIEKFLRVCWAIDPNRGEANFDIDQERLDPRTPHLFPEMDVAKKISLFQRRLEERLLNNTINSDAQIYLYCLREGMLPKHGRSVISELKKAGKIRVIEDRQPRVSRDGYREPRALEVVADGTV